MKLTAVATLVVLALTGFSTGRGHGGSHGHSGGGGGGCSSSSQNHDSSSSSSSSGGSSGSSGSTYDDDDYSYGDDSSGSSSASGGSGYTRRPGYRSTPSSSASGGDDSLEEGTTRLVRCATARQPYATVEVTNPNSRTHTFEVFVIFRDAQDTQVDAGRAKVKVRGDGKATVKVPFDDGQGGSISAVDHCDVDPKAFT
ncbi:hypothetical protein [Streptomyces sp. SGAir0957]